jgi:hypothetical protein
MTETESSRSKTTNRSKTTFHDIIFDCRRFRQYNIKQYSIISFSRTKLKSTCLPLTMMELPQKKYSHHHYLDACKIWFNPDGPRAATELKQLPLEEREKVWADLTGREATTTFTQNIKEDAEMLKSKLLELSTALETADRVRAIDADDNVDKKCAFDLARESNPEYVRSESFRLKFLRASGYDPRRCPWEGYSNHRP